MTTNQQRIILQTELPEVQLLARGKVRDVYAVGEQLLIVATDRISAFDYILPTGIPGKGRVLTQLSVFWFDFLRDVTPTHFITADVDKYPEPLRRYRDQLEGRSMLVKRANMIDVECVARGYLSGSGWKEYRETGRVCGIQLPAGGTSLYEVERELIRQALEQSRGNKTTAARLLRITRDTLRYKVKKYKLD